VRVQGTKVVLVIILYYNHLKYFYEWWWYCNKGVASAHSSGRQRLPCLLRRPRMLLSLTACCTCLACTACSCNCSPARLPPHVAARMHASLCLLLRVSLCFRATRPCLCMQVGTTYTRALACCCAPRLVFVLRARGRACKWEPIYFYNIQWNIYNIQINIWNILGLIMKTLVTWNTCCNICLKQVKYLKIQLQYKCIATVTYATSK
jgi:hypothetical protein